MGGVALGRDPAHREVVAGVGGHPERRLLPTQAPPHPCCFLALRPLCGQPIRALAASSLLRPLRPPTFAFGLARRQRSGLSRQPPFLELPLILRPAVALAAAARAQGAGTVAPRRALRWHPRFRRCHPSSPDDGRDACSWRWGGCAGCARRGDCFAMRLVGCRRGRSRPVAVAADNYKGSSRGRAQAFGAWAWVRTMCRCSSRVRRGQL